MAPCSQFGMSAQSSISRVKAAPQRDPRRQETMARARNARRRSIEHVMEMLAHAPSSHQPTFSNLPRCRRPRLQRRDGACRSVQQQDRAVRAGGAPVRRKPERRADGAAIDWRTARSPTDACLGQTRRAEGASEVRGDLGTRQAARCARKSCGVHAGARLRQANVQSAMID
jgi:hypothetical protein